MLDPVVTRCPREGTKRACKLIGNLRLALAWILLNLNARFLRVVVSRLEEEVVVSNLIQVISIVFGAFIAEGLRLLHLLDLLVYFFRLFIEGGPMKRTQTLVFNQLLRRAILRSVIRIILLDWWVSRFVILLNNRLCLLS